LTQQKSLILPSYALVKEHFFACLAALEEKSVELIGIEPTTSSLQSWRSPS
jgi:hypothetical protein